MKVMNLSSFNEVHHPISHASVEPEEEKGIELLIKWNSNTFEIPVALRDTLAALKQMIFELTNVLPKRQKIIGFTPPKNRSDDQITIGELSLKDKQKLMMVGTPEKDIFIDLSAGAGDDVMNDFDLEYTSNELDEVGIDVENRKKLEKCIKNLNINFINPPRLGKKLLVLDIDHTLFDMKTQARSLNALKRPFTDEMLTAIYPQYDIVFWSQTSWRWLEIKLTEMGLLMNPNYHICFVLDKSCMFSITSRRGKHHVKPLDVIWSQYPDRWGPQNTIHVDDLRRNFAMNPQSGLKVTPFKNAPVARTSDCELLLLSRYLLLIADCEDFRKLNHNKWKRFLADQAPKQ